MSEGTREMTLGEKRVRRNFNPSANADVEKLKKLAADLIDACESLKAKDARLASLAQTSFEEGAMWAVKAATA
jgi:hypothetical protein